MTRDPFVNLHSHSMHSHMDAIVRIKELFARAVELGQDTVALTDHGVMAGAYEAYKEYKKYKERGVDLKFIPGNEIYFVEDLTEKKAKRRHLVLLAMNETGYRNLLRITAEGFSNAVTVMNKQFPRVDADVLRRYNEGLVATSACGGSLVAAQIFQGDREKAITAAELFRDIFGDRFFIELQPHELQRGDFNQQFLNDQLKSIAEEMGIPMIATCDSHYLTPKHEKYHDMVLAIGSKKPLDDMTRHRYATVKECLVCSGSKHYPADSEDLCYACMGTGVSAIEPCPEFYLKSGKQIEDIFAQKYDREFAQTLVANTRKIADMCEMPDYMEPTGNRLPTFPWQEEDDADEFRKWLASRSNLALLKSDAAYLRFRIWKYFQSYCKDFDKETKQVYWKRILNELEILEMRDFSSYMLIVADYVVWAKDNGIRVGPGRGSCGGSLVGFLLGIHMADPIKYGLLFERFQNRQKKAMPDIDLDFAPSGREKVIQYCKDKYGADHVAYISNILRLTPKLVIKDVSRSLQIGGDKSAAFQIANKVTASIPDMVKTDDGKMVKIDSMEKALKYSKPLQEFIMEHPEVLDYANQLIGLPRSFATHAAGVIIADVPLNEYVPLRYDKDGSVAIQYDKNLCEEVGLIKMDFLGLDTLDTLQETWEMSQELGMKGLPLPESIPLDDAKTYKLIESGHVAGVFQLAGSLAALCKSLKPRTIEDIALVNALGRPSCSPAERREFINRRFGKTKTTYIHPSLEPVLQHTNGISVYEEDLLHLARHIAGWDLSEADGLRKVTKLKEKGAALAEELEKKFIADGMKQSGLKKEEAEQIWNNVVIPFSKYGFNKSHAVLYSMISYYTAFYKVHAPGPFLCASLNVQTRSNKRDRDEQIDILKRECKKFQVKIEACDINISKQYYTMKDRKTIVTGLGAIKGIGDKALNAIIEHQPYRSFEDFLYRTPSTVVNKSVIIALAKAGAFDSLEVPRKYASEQYGEIRKDILKFVKKLDDSYFEDGHRDKPLPHILDDFEYKNIQEIKAPDWDLKEKLTYEKEVLGEYVSGSVETLYPGFFKGGAYAVPYSRLANMHDGANFQTEGLVSSVREIIIKKSGRNRGKAMAKVTIENVRGEAVDVTMWPDQYSRFKRHLKKDTPLRGLFKVNEYNGQKSLVLVNLEAVYQESN